LKQSVAGIEVRLISVERKLDEHTVILASLRIRVESLHGLVEKLEVRTGRVEQEYIMITSGLRRLEDRFDALEAARLAERIRALESRVAALESSEV
jgi:chromosome segregation ATPase